jgi:hypothetical protein
LGPRLSNARVNTICFRNGSKLAVEATRRAYPR